MHLRSARNTHSFLSLPGAAFVTALLSSAVAASETPRLSVSRQNAEITVSWPLDAAEWVLEQSPDLNLPLSWQEVAPVTYQSSSSNLFATVPLPSETMFYRLQAPINPAIGVGELRWWSR